MAHQSSTRSPPLSCVRNTVAAPAMEMMAVKNRVAYNKNALVCALHSQCVGASAQLKHRASSMRGTHRGGCQTIGADGEEEARQQARVVRQEHKDVALHVRIPARARAASVWLRSAGGLP